MTACLVEFKGFVLISTIFIGFNIDLVISVVYMNEICTPHN